MELSKYIGKTVKVNLANGFFYRGLVLPDTTDDSLCLLDIKGSYVSIREDLITLIKEVEE